MNANSFAFPPPPPPPPQAANTQATTANNDFSHGRGDKRWERGSRGPGRGNGTRGVRGGNGYVRGGNAARNGNQYGGGGYPLPNYPSVQQPQYPTDLRSTYSNSPPSYAPVVNQPNSQHTYPYYPPAYPHGQPQSTSYAYTLPSYNQARQPQPYQPHHVLNQRPNDRYASPPVAMGPPIRLGFDNQRAGDSGPFPPNQHGYNNTDTAPYPSVSTTLYQRGSPHGSQSEHYRSSNQQRRGRGHFNGRARADAPGLHHNSNRKTQVAPAVPCFGNPLPTKPPATQMEVKKLRKKKRRVNQLGLTPNMEEHISSSEDEDADEELKLASTVTGSGASDHALKISYKGQTLTLQSSKDIASWIEERKKRFPTAARQAEEDVRLRKLKENKDEQREASKEKRLLERQLKTLEKDKQAAKEAAVEKSKLKVEKLRHKLEKEERRAAKAEAKTLKRSAPHDKDEDDSREAKKKRSEGISHTGNAEERGQALLKVEPSDSLEYEMAAKSSQKTESDPVLKRIEHSHEPVLEKVKEESPSLVPDPLTPTSQPSLPEKGIEPEPKTEIQEIGDLSTLQQPLRQPAAGSSKTPGISNQAVGSAVSSSSSRTAISSDESSDDDDDDDDTSSSGSSSSGSDSDTEGPERRPSGRTKPQRVEPPKRGKQQDKAICRDFLRTGRCRRGKKCRWRHALPDRGQKKAEQSTLSRPERKSLHQRLVEQEKGREGAERNKFEQQKHEAQDYTQATAA
ncbi:MAG: hypothetical protein Q9170_000352 [Blastenia crenularia]